MDKKTFWIIAGIALLALVSLFVWQTMQINALASSSSGVARAVSSVASQSASSGMVGGC